MLLVATDAGHQRSLLRLATLAACSVVAVALYAYLRPRRVECSMQRSAAALGPFSACFTSTIVVLADISQRRSLLLGTMFSSALRLQDKVSYRLLVGKRLQRDKEADGRRTRSQPE